MINNMSSRKYLLDKDGHTMARQFVPAKIRE